MHIHVCICNKIELVNDSNQSVQGSRSTQVGRPRRCTRPMKPLPKARLKTDKLAKSEATRALRVAGSGGAVEPGGSPNDGVKAEI
jgi:hypothetical protein